jgi:hypothetical protein
MLGQPLHIPERNSNMYTKPGPAPIVGAERRKALFSVFKIRNSGSLTSLLVDSHKLFNKATKMDGSILSANCSREVVLSKDKNKAVLDTYSDSRQSIKHTPIITTRRALDRLE